MSRTDVRTFHALKLRMFVVIGTLCLEWPLRWTQKDVARAGKRPDAEASSHLLLYILRKN